MAYDEQVATRVRASLEKHRHVAEKKMFGGIAFMVGGHMAVGVLNDELMVRVGPEAYEKALSRPHAREMDFTGRPLRGFLYVAPAGFRSAAGLRRWVHMAVTFAESLPAKRTRATKPTSKASRSRPTRPKTPSTVRRKATSRVRRTRRS